MRRNNLVTEQIKLAGITIFLLCLSLGPRSLFANIIGTKANLDGKFTYIARTFDPSDSTNNYVIYSDCTNPTGTRFKYPIYNRPEDKNFFSGNYCKPMFHGESFDLKSHENLVKLSDGMVWKTYAAKWTGIALATYFGLKEFGAAFTTTLRVWQIGRSAVVVGLVPRLVYGGSTYLGTTSATVYLVTEEAVTMLVSGYVASGLYDASAKAWEVASSGFEGQMDPDRWNELNNFFNQNSIQPSVKRQFEIDAVDKAWSGFLDANKNNPLVSDFKQDDYVNNPANLKKILTDQNSWKNFRGFAELAKNVEYVDAFMSSRDYMVPISGEEIKENLYNVFKQTEMYELGAKDDNNDSFDHTLGRRWIKNDFRLFHCKTCTDEEYADKVNSKSLNDARNKWEIDLDYELFLSETKDTLKNIVSQNANIQLASIDISIKNVSSISINTNHYMGMNFNSRGIKRYLSMRDVLKIEIFHEGLFTILLCRLNTKADEASSYGKITIDSCKGIDRYQDLYNDPDSKLNWQQKNIISKSLRIKKSIVDNQSSWGGSLYNKDIHFINN